MPTEILLYAFLLFLSIQLFYYLFYFVRIASHKESFKIDQHKPVSVIVCAHNELENLKMLIPSILEQNYHSFELVIVNDRSYDGSYEFLEEQKKLHSIIKVVNVEEVKANMDPKKYALTLGIKASRYEHLLFTDADCRPTNKNWILQVQSKFTEDCSLVLGVSQYEKRKGLLNLLIQFETLYTTMQYISFALRGAPYMGIGRNIAYKKDLFLNNKGFHPFMYVTGGDDDLFVGKVATKKNTNIIISIDSQTISIPKVKWKDWIKQKTRHASVSKYYKLSVKLKLGFLNFSHLFFYLLFFFLLFEEEYLNFGLIGLYVRWLAQVIAFSLVAKRLRYSISGWKVIIFDFIYPLYYLFIGLRVLVNKSVKWN